MVLYLGLLAELLIVHRGCSQFPVCVHIPSRGSVQTRTNTNTLGNQGRRGNRMACMESG